MPGPAELERIVEAVIARLRRLLGVGPCPLCGHHDPARRPEASPPEAAGGPATDHPGRFLGEDDVVRFYRSGARLVRLAPRCIVTPAARDRARDLGVDLAG